MELSTILTHCRPMDHARNAAIASRLRHFRNAMGYSGHGDKTRFCNQLGVGLKAYYHAERGTAISRQLIQKIVEKYPGITEGWFYRGDLAGVETPMAIKLGLVRWKDNPVGLL